MATDYTLTMHIVDDNILGEYGTAASSTAELYVEFYVGNSWVNAT